MKSDRADPPFETSAIGTPLGYTEHLYRIYLETRDADGAAERALKGFLGTERARRLVRLTHGFELELPIQCVPDVIRLLARENVAIYQVVRYAKIDGARR
jgi:hypothetical protein